MKTRISIILHSNKDQYGLSHPAIYGLSRPAIYGLSYPAIWIPVICQDFVLENFPSIGYPNKIKVTVSLRKLKNSLPVYFTHTWENYITWSMVPAEEGFSTLYSSAIKILRSLVPYRSNFASKMVKRYVLVEPYEDEKTKN